MRAILLAVVMALAFPRSGAAAPPTSCKLALLNSIPITVTPDGSSALVTVTINGTDEKFVLDTGGAATQISAKVAQELKLPVTEFNGTMLDMYGRASTSAVRVSTFGLGRLQDRNATLPVMTATFNDASFAGLFAADYMAKYDVELDFSAGKLNYFSQEHCPGKVIYWPATVGTAVPMQFRDNHLNLSVTLDGHPVRAMIDTGATGTTLSARAAKQDFGVTSEGASGKAFKHVFGKLSFEGLEVNNPNISVLPDLIGSKDPNNGYVTGSRLHRMDDPDSADPVMLIGMNILSKLHLYIAFSEHMIYITPASGPPQQQ
jgi:predicted aspartyl protease